jgi:hypothetical protein
VSDELVPQGGTSSERVDICVLLMLQQHGRLHFSAMRRRRTVHVLLRHGVACVHDASDCSSRHERYTSRFSIDAALHALVLVHCATPIRTKQLLATKSKHS